MTITDDKEIVDTQLPREVSFYPFSTEQAVLDTDASFPFKWMVGTTNGNIVVENIYGGFAYYDSTSVTPGAWLPTIGKKIVTSHDFGAPMGVKTTTVATIYLYRGI